MKYHNLSKADFLKHKQIKYLSINFFKEHLILKLIIHKLNRVIDR